MILISLFSDLKHEMWQLFVRGFNLKGQKPLDPTGLCVCFFVRHSTRTAVRKVLRWRYQSHFLRTHK